MTLYLGAEGHEEGMPQGEDDVASEGEPELGPGLDLSLVSWEC